MNGNSRDEGEMPGAEIADKSSSLVAQTDGINANASGGDDDFFERLRLRQTAIEEEAQAEELNKSMVDSTPEMMVLDTHPNKHDDIPSLTSNISPTSISTASSEEKYSDDVFLTCGKSEKEIPVDGEPRTTSDLRTTAASPTSITKCGLFIVLGLLSGASWFSCKEITTGFKVSTFTSSKYNANPFPYREAEQMSFDIFHNFQDARKRPHLYEQQNELYSLDESLPRKPQESNSETHATDHVQQQMKMDVVQQRGPKNTMSRRVLKTKIRRSNKMYGDKYIQMKKMSPSSSSSGSTMSKILTMTIVEKVQRISEQVTNTLATLAGDLAGYLNSAAKTSKFRMHQNVNHIVQHLNSVMKNLASKNSEIQAGGHSMVGGRESLMHVATAAQNVAKHLNEMTKHLASTNTEIQANNIHMVGVRESFTKIRTTVRKRTSRIVTRRLKIDAIYF